MRKQQEIWLQEHTGDATLPTMANVDPASGVVTFGEYLREHEIAPGLAIDIGCGKGRNSVFMASLGYDVTGVDYIEPALAAAKKLAEARGETVAFRQAEIDSLWPFDDETFDVAIDSFSSIDIETKQGREICRDEMFRTLKVGGSALVTVVSADDEWEKEQIKTSPGEEPNSTIWPQNGKFQKDYDKAEVREFYKKFTVLDFRTISKPAFKLGKNYTATNLWLVLQKPTHVQ